MLTLFSTPKHFRGHIGVIQRNALQSWKLLHVDVQVFDIGFVLQASSRQLPGGSSARFWQISELAKISPAR